MDTFSGVDQPAKETSVSAAKNQDAATQEVRDGSLFLNSASWVSARALSGLARTAILLAIARHYGPKDFGEIVLAISLTEIFRTISECGLDTIAIRRFRQSPESSKGTLLGAFVGTKMLLATVGYAVSILALFAIANTGREILLGAVAGLSLFSANVVGAFSSYFQSRFSMSQVLLTTAISIIILIIFTAISVVCGWSIVVVIAGLPVAEGVNVALLWGRCRERIRLRFEPREALALLGESLPMGVMGAMVILYFRLDNLFIFKFCGAAALGLYAAASRIVEPLLMIPHSFSTTLYSLFSGRRDTCAGVKVGFRSVLRTMWPAYGFAVTAAIIAIGGGHYFLGYFFPEYLSAYPVLRLLAIVLLIRTGNVTLTAILCSFGRYSTLARISVATLVINVGLAVILIPRYGPWGAALAAILTESWNFLAQWRAAGSSVSSANVEATLAQAKAD
jgi:O-antigen/teichoic acid export membrane protein